MDNQPITPEIPPTPSGFNPDSFGSSAPKNKSAIIVTVIIVAMVIFSTTIFIFFFTTANNMFEKTANTIQSTIENTSKQIADNSKPQNDSKSTTKEKVEEGCYTKSDLYGTWLHEPDYEMLFLENGTGTYSYRAKENTFEYSISGCDTLKIKYKGSTSAFETTMRIEDDILIILDSYGEEVEYEKQ